MYLLAPDYLPPRLSSPSLTQDHLTKKFDSDLLMLPQARLILRYYHHPTSISPFPYFYSPYLSYCILLHYHPVRPIACPRVD